jgi:protein involved in polysaccharide export with SLBB domain
VIQFCLQIRGCRRRCLDLAAAWVVGVGCALAQAPEKGVAAALAEQCAGPLGTYLPECQAIKSAPVIAPASKTGSGGPDAPSLRAPSAKVPEAEEKNETPAVPAPEPPSEFQRFVASSVGQVLPIFGAGLFARVPSTFAPVDRAPVPAEHILGPGDEILLRVWGQVNLDLALTVDRGGAVFIPRAGNINVAGVTFQKLPDHLRTELGRVFRNFDLNVSMGQLRSIQIFVVGQARRPGAYTVSSLSTLVNALFASGGPSLQGSMRSIQLKRGASVVTEFDLYDLLLRGDKSKDVALQPGDVVYVPPAGPQVALAGSVKTAAIYELRGEQTAGEVIQMGGGLSPLADAQRATLERIANRSSRTVMSFGLDATGLRTRVADGDILNLLTITPQFANAVTLRGNVPVCV